MQRHDATFAGRAAAALTLIALLSIPALAGGRRRVVAVSCPADELAVSVLGVTIPGSDALLDAGTIRWEPGLQQVRVTRMITLRIGSEASSGTAVLRASVDAAHAQYRVTVDGVALGGLPRIIDPRAKRGVPATHRLEIVVPPEAPEGELALTIRWEATSE